MDCSQEERLAGGHKNGYSRPSSQVRGGPAPLASFEDLPTGRFPYQFYFLIFFLFKLGSINFC